MVMFQLERRRSGACGVGGAAVVGRHRGSSRERAVADSGLWSARQGRPGEGGSAQRTGSARRWSEASSRRTLAAGAAAPLPLPSPLVAFLPPA
jgi:hypothetical protein